MQSFEQVLMHTIAELICNNLQELSSIAQRIILIGKDYHLWAFEGPMGAGKTTLIKAICKQLGIQDEVQSPTFSLVNEYKSLQGRKVYHFDFYRINTETEAMDIGYEEYFFNEEALVLVEWASKVATLLPDRYLFIEVIPIDEKSRKFLISQK